MANGAWIMGLPNAVNAYFRKAMEEACAHGIGLMPFDARAVRYGVEPTFLAFLSEAKGDAVWAREVEAWPEFSRKRMANIARVRFIECALNSIRQAFEKENIRFLVLKGARIGRELFGAAEARATTDIDLWISESRLSQARAVLAKLGYSVAPSAPCADSPRYWATNQEIAFHETWPAVELHWRLGRPGLVMPSFDEAYAVSRNDAWGGGVRVPSVCDMWIVLLVHALEHMFALKTLIDGIAFCARYESEARKLCRYAENFGLRRLSVFFFELYRLLSEGHVGERRFIVRFVGWAMIRVWQSDCAFGGELVVGKDSKIEAALGVILRGVSMFALDGVEYALGNALRAWFYGPHGMGKCLNRVILSREKRGV